MGGDDVRSSPAVVDGVIYIVLGDGYVYAVDVGDGRRARVAGTRILS